jgi:hypothetical protein
MKYYDKEMLCFNLDDEMIFVILFETNIEIQQLLEKGEIYRELFTNNLYMTKNAFEKVMYYLQNLQIKKWLQDSYDCQLEKTQNWA